VKDVFAKKFFWCRERIPLSALAPARSALLTNRQSTPWSTAMLAEIYRWSLRRRCGRPRKRRPPLRPRGLCRSRYRLQRRPNRLAICPPAGTAQRRGRPLTSSWRPSFWDRNARVLPYMPER